MKALGWLLFVVGGLALFAGFGSDTTVPTEDGRRVHNIGLMSEKQNTILFGGALALIGAVFIGFSGRRAPAASELLSDTKNCPFCAETIKAGAIVCRFCNRELAATTPEVHKPKAQTSAHTDPAPSEHALMAQWGISHDGYAYVYKDYRYSKLEDAVAYARLRKT